MPSTHPNKSQETLHALATLEHQIRKAADAGLNTALEKAAAPLRALLADLATLPVPEGAELPAPPSIDALLSEIHLAYIDSYQQRRLAAAARAILRDQHGLVLG